MEFKVGDIVMIKGKIVRKRTDNTNYVLEFISDAGNVNMFFTKEGSYSLSSGLVDLELIERPKKKVVKYKVLYYLLPTNEYRVTTGFYSSKEDFEQHFNLKFMQLLESTAKEYEE